MQVIYAAPFFVLAIVGFLCCVAIRRFRTHALQAFVAPLAFGVCSIIAFALVAVGSDTIGRRFGVTFPNWAVLALGIFAYFLVGIGGACIAVWVLQHLRSRTTLWRMSLRAQS